MDGTVTRDGTTDTTTNETVAENQNGDKRFADTPQTTVGDNPNNAYMTNFTKESQTRDTTTNATSNSTPPIRSLHRPAYHYTAHQTS